MTTYYTLFATKTAPPPSAIRGRDYDYGQLPTNEQVIINLVLDEQWDEALTPLPMQVKQFLRRYHPSEN